MRDARADRDGLRARLAKADDRQGALARCAPGSTAPAAASPARERDVAALGQEVSYATVDLAVAGHAAAPARPPPPGDRWTPGRRARRRRPRARGRSPACS